MQVKQAQGYSKEKALENAGIDVELGRLKNATQKWKKLNSPINSKDLRKFFEVYVKDNKAVGAYIVVESSLDDTRTRPYTVINEVTNGKRKTKTAYQIKEGSFKVKYTSSVNEQGEEVKTPNVEVLSLGAVAERADKKDLAMKKMKELIAATGKDYVIEIVKEVNEGQKYAAYGQYTPSKSAKEGKFVFFVEE